MSSEMTGINTNKRLKVGLLVSEYYDSFMRDACEGCMLAAEELDTDLYLLTGGYLKSSFTDATKNKFEYQNNAIFNFAVETGLDVVIVYLGTIANQVDDVQRKAFMDQFQGIPVITVASEFEGYSSILFDNKGGFANGVEYLIKEQGRKKIGMVSGPATSVDANERLDAYREVLKKYNLPYDDSMVVYGTFSEYSDQYVRDLLDRHPDLDAIAFANDHMARGGYRVFEERGIKVGKDIAVTGFDDADFAKLMTPSLTTTKADSMELGYQAFVKACEMIGEMRETGKQVVKEYRVDTTLIIRESCGGRTEHLDAESNEIDPQKVDFDSLVETILAKTFDYSPKNSSLPFLRNQVKELLDWMNENVYGKKITTSIEKQAIRRYDEVLSSVAERTQQTAPLYDLTNYIFELYLPHVEGEKSALNLQGTKAEIYRNIQIAIDRRKDQSLRGNNALNWIMMDITRDTNGDSTEEEKYRLLLRKMNTLEYDSSFILLFPSIIECESKENWKRPDKLEMKVYQKQDQVIIPEENMRYLPVDNMFILADGKNDKRKTLVVTMLFCGIEQYGVFVVEVKKHNLSFIEPLRFQISSALQTMSLFSDKEKMTKQLEINLLELKESNAFLDEVSKSDELTQIYNRRGFLVTAKKQVRNLDNYGKKAMFVYADMNNLKLVNDQFGHEEGDYSLKAIANILKAAFGPGSIVGRMGGDEFAAFMIADEKRIAEDAFNEETFQNKITEETEYLNANNDKKYYVSLSAGMKFFTIEEDTDFEQMMADADADLYQWKKVKRKEILKVVNHNIVKL